MCHRQFDFVILEQSQVEWSDTALLVLIQKLSVPKAVVAHSRQASCVAFEWYLSVFLNSGNDISRSKDQTSDSGNKLPDPIVIFS